MIVKIIGWYDRNGNKHLYPDDALQYYAPHDSFILYFDGLQYELGEDGWLRPYDTNAD